MSRRVRARAEFLRFVEIGDARVPYCALAVREAGVADRRSFTRVIEPLLRVAHSIEQLATNSARERVEMTAKIDNVGHDQLGGGAGRWCAQIGDEIGDREIDLVSNRGDDRQFCRGNGARDDFLIELPQIFDAAAAARDDDQIDRCEIFVRCRQLADRDGDFLRCAAALHAHRTD